MDKNLIIELVQDNNCHLTIIDNSSYGDLGDSLLNYITLELLIYNEDNRPIPNSIKISEFTSNRDYYLKENTVYKLDKDGIYSYNKFLIPKLKQLEISNKPGYYNISNEVFYNETTKEIYLGPVNGLSEYPASAVEDASTLSTYDSYVSDETHNVDILDYITTDNKGSQTFFADQKLFSICKLQKCLISLQKRMLLDNAKLCTFEKCNINQMLKQRCDFLLCAIYTLNYLICNQNYIEAQRIIDNLSTCDNICADELDTSYNGCGCG